MLTLLLGLVIFIAIHLVPTQPDMRRALAVRMGEGAWKGVFSLISLAGFVLIVVGYHKLQLHPGKNPVLWSPPPWGRHATMALMLPVFPLLIATYLPGRIAGAIRHPMITAVKFWALAHLLVRGDLGSILLFLGLLAWAVYDRISLKHREAAGLVTVKSGPLANDVIAVVGGLILYAVFVKWGHPALIGVQLIP
ncbi:MAG: NnrU family protein [Hyphomicrobiaceae bacterium]|nr:NnrU family protein [Hyphomicrobiaceae bacterium]